MRTVYASVPSSRSRTEPPSVVDVSSPRAWSAQRASVNRVTWCVRQAAPSCCTNVEGSCTSSLPPIRFLTLSGAPAVAWGIERGSDCSRLSPGGEFDVGPGRAASMVRQAFPPVSCMHYRHGSFASSTRIGTHAVRHRGCPWRDRSHDISRKDGAGASRAPGRSMPKHSKLSTHTLQSPTAPQCSASGETQTLEHVFRPLCG